MKRKILILTLAIIISIYSIWDNHLFTQFFRNPHIVEVAQLDEMQANKWYEFGIDTKALNRTQEIWVSFKGSESPKLESHLVGADENFQGGEWVFTSHDYPARELKFDVVVIDSDDVEYKFKASGISGGIIFIYDQAKEDLIGKHIERMKIQSNLTYKDVEITWMSRTGK